MKSTANLLLAGSWATALALAAKTELANKLLWLKSSEACTLNPSGHAGTYGLLLPVRSADS
jgi:hypothetical protein